MDDVNQNIPGVGSDQGQAPIGQQPEPTQPVEQPQVPSEPTVPQPGADVPGQTNPEPTVGA